MSLAPAELDATVSSIARAQLPDGAIPWYPGGHVDPWNHVEATMALDVGGRHLEAGRAYRWLATAQRSDGAWPASVRRGRVRDATLDANFSAYAAAGAWHHWLATGDRSFVGWMWPTVERALDFVLRLQRTDGAIAWARDAGYRPWPRALLSSSSCIHLSLGCAISLAGLTGNERPDWELSQTNLAHAIGNRRKAFENKDRFSMDWYYPVLGGVLRREAGAARIDSRWEHFVEEGLGVRCVADRPWVTTAETCELVLALDALGLQDRAESLFDWVQHLRAADGSYWTGATFPDGTRWPVEQTTWSSGAVVLAYDALAGSSDTSGFFRSEGDAVPVASQPLADPF
ncbi:MAG: prenyltransferase [Actinomycetota bacterium]